MIWVHGFHLAILPAFLDRTVKVSQPKLEDDVAWHRVVRLFGDAAQLGTIYSTDKWQSFFGVRMVLKCRLICTQRLTSVDGFVRVS